MAGGRLRADPLFQGLARPPMIMGVSYMYFVANAMLTMVMYINSGSILAFFFGIIIHLFGYLLCMREPRAVELWMLRMRFGFKTWNRPYYHHTNSYDVF
jgi:type IV secretion system protein VirB3